MKRQRNGNPSQGNRLSRASAPVCPAPAHPEPVEGPPSPLMGEGWGEGDLPDGTELEPAPGLTRG